MAAGGDEGAACRGQRLCPQARAIQEVGQQPVAVELEEGHEVRGDVQPQEHGEQQQHRAGGSADAERQQAGQAGQDDVGQRSGGTLGDACPTGEEEGLGGVHVEARCTPVEPEPHAAQPTAVVDDHQAVGGLVQHGGQQFEGHEDQRRTGRWEGLGRQGPAVPQLTDEGGQAHGGDDGPGDHRGPTQQETQAPTVGRGQHGVGPVDLDAVVRERDAATVTGGSLQEPLGAQRPDQGGVPPGVVRSVGRAVGEQAQPFGFVRGEAEAAAGPGGRGDRPGAVVDDLHRGIEHELACRSRARRGGHVRPALGAPSSPPSAWAASSSATRCSSATTRR